MDEKLKRVGMWVLIVAATYLIVRGLIPFLTTP
jgi:hypothetical protein